MYVIRDVVFVQINIKNCYYKYLIFKTILPKFIIFDLKEMKDIRNKNFFTINKLNYSQGDFEINLPHPYPIKCIDFWDISKDNVTNHLFGNQ